MPLPDAEPTHHAMDTPEALLAECGLAAPLVRMQEPEAAALVASSWGMTGSFTRFATEKDDTFLVTPDSGPRLVLKLSNPQEPEADIELQTELLLHVAEADPALPVPRVVPARGGAAWFTFVDRAGQTRIARALTYLEGTPLDRFDTTPRERERLGAMLGRLRHAMAGFSHPHDGRVVAWDVQHLPRLRGLVAHIDDAGRRSALDRGLDRFEALFNRIGALPRQVVHNDCGRSNVVADRDTPGFVSGIIDFGDVVRTAVAIDVATTLLNQLSLVPADDIFTDGRDVLRGYLSTAPLAEAELAMVPHLVMGRVIARALITTWRAGMMPDNATYILRNTHPSWHQLDWFLARGVDDVSAVFMDLADTAGTASHPPGDTP
ncbi:phosphotransferase [uncultured Alsobacter sp.]|uniref:phosphotransferase n=1 Tax=uncultured Alsobacter sp. TaxID=1748258 RepID=UPI0025E6EBDD|nr:phosphotransferase [uncultured Alsobacter sp.]